MINFFLIYIFVFLEPVYSDFRVNVKLCTDKDSETGVVDGSTGDNLRLLIKYDGGTGTWVREVTVDVGLAVETAGVKSIEFIGNSRFGEPYPELSEMSIIQLRYSVYNILCLEQLQMESLDKSLQFDMIQDYLPHAWDVNVNPNSEIQPWTSDTGKKITYWTAACLLNQANNAISTTIPFANGCYSKIIVQVKPVNECVDATASCDDNAVCKDTDKAYKCECNAGYEGTGMVNTYGPSGCREACGNGRTRNSAGVCECNDFCGTRSACIQDTAEGSWSCGCNEGYETDTTLTTSTQLFCRNEKEYAVFAPKRNNLDHTIPTLYKQWTISLDIRPNGLVSNYGSIMRLGHGTNAAYGDRIPAIFFKSQTTQLYIAYDINGRTSNYFGITLTDPIPMNEWSRVELTQLRQTDGSYQYTVQVNGEIIDQKSNTAPEDFTDVKVYTSDNNYLAAKAFIANLKIDTFPEDYVYNTLTSNNLNVDECTTNAHTCPENTVCADTATSYTCNCVSGYEAGLDENGMTCTDINECLTKSHNCASGAAASGGATCINTAGSFNCKCPSGYKGDGVTCTLIKFRVNVQLCTDQDSTTGVAYGAAGSKSLYIKLYNENTLKWETEHMVNVAIDKQLAGVTSIELKGDLSVTSQVQIRYIGGNSICLEMLQLESLEDTETHFDMIQDYDAHAWDVTSGNQEWTSNTGKKIQFWHYTCTSNEKTESAKPYKSFTPFISSCHSKVTFQIKPVNECVDATASCDDNSSCKDTDKAYTCECNAGYEGTGMVNPKYPVACIVECVSGQTRNANTGLCECSVNCGTGAACTKDTESNSYSCTCNEGSKQDTTLSTPTNYYCKEEKYGVFATKRNTLYHTIPTLYKQWSLSVDIRPTGLVTGYSSILRIGSGPNNSRYGDRMPAIFFEARTTRLQIASGINSKTNYISPYTDPLPMNKWTRVEVSQLRQTDGKYLYTIRVAGKIHQQTTNSDAREFSNMKVYTSDNYYVTADALLTNLKIDSLPDNYVFNAVCPITHPFAYNNGDNCCATNDENCENGDYYTCTSPPCSNNLNVNECSTNPDICGENTICTDTDTSYTCDCVAQYDFGYDADGITCTDVDECEAGTHKCPSVASCTNTIGSYTCACNAGYETDTELTTLTQLHCSDINECDTAQCPLGEACQNTNGGYNCVTTTTTTTTRQPTTGFVYASSCSQTVDRTTGMINAVCLKCMNDKMIGSVRLDSIHTESLMATTEQGQIDELLKIAAFNTQKAHGTGSCNSNFQYDSRNKIFTFDIDLGECGMKTMLNTDNGQNYIQFSQELEFVPSFLQVFFGSSGKFTFKCNYKTEASTNDANYEVLVRITGNEAEQFLSWGNGMKINMYRDETFKAKLSPQSLVVGNRFNVDIEWVEQFSAAMPVRFYIDVCTVSSSDGLKSFDILLDGCISDLVQTKRHLSVPANYHSLYAVDHLRFSYKSFSFVRTTGSYNMQLSCNVGFCLKSDLPNVNGIGGTCGVDTSNCPSDYSRGL